MFEAEAVQTNSLQAQNHQNIPEVTSNLPMKIDHLESVLYLQVKDSMVKEDLKGSSWKVLHPLENLMALALNY